MLAIRLGIERKTFAKILPDVLAQAGLSKGRQYPVSDFSLGMYLRLAFSVVMATRPDVIVMDEVFSTGDMFFRELMVKMLDECADGTSCVFVSHSADVIRAVSRRLLVVDGGKIIHDGDVEEGLKLYAALDIPPDDQLW